MGIEEKLPSGIRDDAGYSGSAEFVIPTMD